MIFADGWFRLHEENLRAKMANLRFSEGLIFTLCLGNMQLRYLKRFSYEQHSFILVSGYSKHFCFTRAELRNDAEEHILWYMQW